MSDEVTEPKDRLDYLSDVLDAQLKGDDEAAADAFHNYLTQTTTNILHPVVDEVQPEIEDDITTDVDDNKVADEIEGLDDINIDDHLAGTENDDPATGEE